MQAAETRSFIIPKRQETRSGIMNETSAKKNCVYDFFRDLAEDLSRERLSHEFIIFCSVLLLSSFHLQWKMSSLPNRARN